MEKKKFDPLEEQVNDILNIRALLDILVQKRIICVCEFIAEKERALKEFKLEYPQLFE